ncbi:hypothetical protein [Mycobacterium sp. SMC-4]|uniref:hypothetical protein n=1 Tax=Mycobacterium sp. SMC-4 TaxID=2857059 RepID=UPI0021B4C0C5|nr:hypothetical protein [Mycobacterium sp. SMC-4]UXA16163.1 hypothetical protein KXD98_15050 [Mycobacterium sp. SMC-4]
MTDSMRGKRYGEVLLISGGQAQDTPHATVYNTYPLNDCPAELWSRLNPEALAKEHGVLAVILNGPRYWLMDNIEKDMGERVIATFGGIDMIRQATVALTSMSPAPYLPNTVERHAVFVFDAGKPVFELADPDGSRWVMQTWSQLVDSALGYADLAGLGARLALPEGWTYRSRVLDEVLRIDTTDQPAQVLQDNLTNSYSLLTG